MILGQFGSAEIGRLKSPEFAWFQEGYSNAPSSDLSIREIVGAKMAHAGMEVLAFIGTWCGDCHEQFPSFMKLMDEAGVPASRIRIFGLGRDKTLPAPWSAMTGAHKILRLPTFVFLRSGNEIGRIVETPQGDLGHHVARILDDALQEKYSPASACFGCGPVNEKGLRIRSQVSANDPEEIVADWMAESHHEAFPGMLNGGIIGSLLDCHCNWTAAYHLMKKAGLQAPPCTVTADYSIQLKRPTPTDGVIHLSARVVESKEDRATIEGVLTAGGKVCATCRGTFVAVKPGHPAYHRW